ncbi:MAG: mechanosensitive ion channel domain-containing protein [Halorientalis sp.]
MTVSQLLATVVEQFVTAVTAAIPRVLGGLLFLALAFVGIKLVTLVVRSVLERVYPDEQQLVADLGVLVASIFLWFGAGLAFLGIVGLGELAASLGTAVGFLALGVSYALSEMIEDTVAGVYLLRDPDFNPGDTVVTDAGRGTVTAIGLRKSRFRLDGGDTLVLANRSVESEWTKEAGDTANDDGGDGGVAGGDGGATGGGR